VVKIKTASGTVFIWFFGADAVYDKMAEDALVITRHLIVNILDLLVQRELDFYQAGRNLNIGEEFVL
jgi:hypothetical protein